jgi:hypothetical protein
VNNPAENVTLSTAEGEALIVRVHQSNLSADDAGMVERVVRMYFWVAFALQEAKRSVKWLRDVLFGAGRTPKTPPAAEGSPALSDGLGQGESALVPVVEAAECAGESEPSESAVVPQPKGGHRMGTGRLGADAYVGAERTECRHEELAVGQRCPVCGQGTL